ncbi:2Fe-2S iron-sulfur cluster-binding protein [Novosphingobium sp. PASSN1]|uniref:2Fe-2S iron-sulfur cluster-binding protein n=1 Tax=Novosphingobium sp. PASSN1 TaxID=2015561 RepID=UPI000BC4B164|nr:2Fe-2S iron-sulfur cluster-binding protein [Novosphingobium sp. PASSN1]OYU37082.1 MAG: sarcosine oxidase subunit alpha [Novosphingobium sp. PASSN1]
MSGPNRSATGAETIPFTFDGTIYHAQPGDTLAAALLANGIGLVGRSFKYHRPRGIMTAGIEEPNALVTVGTGGRAEPNTRATDVFVYPGMVAQSQNRWPSLSFDAASIFGLAAPALSAGFYYKTFFGPAKHWLRYEGFIRRAAGLGNAPTEADPDNFSHRAGFCDVLVVGSGPAGLKAALEAAEAGSRVMLVEQDSVPGGSLLRDPDPAIDPAAMIERIEALGGKVLLRTTASGYWDHNFLTLTQRLAEPGAVPPHGFAQRLWHVRAGRVVLATGLIERPVPFANNDHPGVMLSQAVRSYVRRWGVLPGKRVVIATNNDDAYLTAEALVEAGAEVVALLDARASGPAAPAGVTVYHDARPASVTGRKHGLRKVTAVIGGSEQSFDADLIAVSGGFVPVSHLHMQAGGKLTWSDEAQAFIPGENPQVCETVGSALNPPPAPAIAPVGKAKKSFVDFQNDVSLADIDLAWQEGYRSVEHLKRYTTLGMATDQGKTSNMTALSRLAEKQGVTVPQAGLTTFRPPYTPVTMGLMAGAGARNAGAHVRRIPLYALHEAQEPIWQPLGYWYRPRAYPVDGEGLVAASLREAQTVRTVAGLSDVSTLGKFEVSGPDAAALLELVCATTVGKLAVGRGRYTFMLREDGFVFDDGTVWRLAENRYLLTSSTGGADRMAHHISYVRNSLRPDLKCSVVNVQEHYAGIALAGPRARAILAGLIGTEPPRHMGYAPGVLAGTPVHVLAASYSGERAFEIHVEAMQAAEVWRAIEAATRAEGGAPYGLEAMELLRIEKGHVVVGGEVDGRSTPHDLGLGGMLNKAGGFIGAAGLTRPALSAPNRNNLVGLVSLDGPIPEGGMLIQHAGQSPQGHVTAAARRILEGGAIALALLEGGHKRHGEELIVTSPTRGEKARVRVTSPHFYDPAGERYRD